LAVAPVDVWTSGAAEVVESSRFEGDELLEVEVNPCCASGTMATGVLSSEAVVVLTV